MESALPQEILLRGDKMFNNTFNGNEGALIGMAMGSMMADQTFRNIIGYKLLQDENRSNDGIGMTLIMNDSNPFRDVNKFMPQPPTIGGIYR